jgi:hypothetical protein
LSKQVSGVTHIVWWTFDRTLGDWWAELISDIGHGWCGPETGNQAQELNLGPKKGSSCKVWGLNPGPTKCYNYVAMYELTRLPGLQCTI